MLKNLHGTQDWIASLRYYLNSGKCKNNKNGVIVFQFTGNFLQDECQIFQEQNGFCCPWFLHLMSRIGILLTSVYYYWLSSATFEKDNKTTDLILLHSAWLTILKYLKPHFS